MRTRACPNIPRRQRGRRLLGHQTLCSRMGSAAGSQLEGEGEQNCLAVCPATISSTQGCAQRLRANKATEKAPVPGRGPAAHTS